MLNRYWRRSSRTKKTAPICTNLLLGTLVALAPSIGQAQEAPASDEVATFPEQSNSHTDSDPSLKNSEPTSVAVSPGPSAAPVIPANRAALPAAPSASSHATLPSKEGHEDPASQQAACKAKGPSRAGFYFRIGTGAGLQTLRGTGPSNDASITGFAQSTIFAVGGSIAPRLVIAATIHGVQTSAHFKGGPYEHAKVQVGDDTVSASKKATAGLSTMGVLVDYFPLPDWGWHAGIGAGLGATSVVNQAVSDSAYYSTSVGGMLTTGYNWHLTGDWSIGVDLTMAATGRSTLKEQSGKEKQSADYRMSGFSLNVMSSILYF